MGLFGYIKKKKEEKEKKESTGCFLAFVLLSEPEWDRTKLIKDLADEWGIQAVEEEEDEKYKDIILTEIDNMRLAISFVPAPVPNEEAENNAALNYMWPEAVDTVKTHKAHIMVAVFGEGADLLDRGRLFVKAAFVCLKQKNALAVYTDGAVYQPEFYCDFAMLMKETGQLPIFNLVWFGIYKTEKQIGVYTFGMKKFGKDEMEIYRDADTAKLDDLRSMMSDFVSYVLEQDVVLCDGETIGFTEKQKMPITRSGGIALDGQTLKIGEEV